MDLRRTSDAIKPAFRHRPFATGRSDERGRPAQMWITTRLGFGFGFGFGFGAKLADGSILTPPSAT
ncbi:hypothetical protein ACPCUV_17565 [Streptomyces platensis]|uniref:hypothetical protein n=1 Tax=Streptomyces platensis TaxID=58346 RepID=UPI003C2C592A